MTSHEQGMFNDATRSVQAYEWRDRTIARLQRKLEPLGPSDKIALLRRIDELLA
jgi:hypothetical protein